MSKKNSENEIEQLASDELNNIFTSLKDPNRLEYFAKVLKVNNEDINLKFLMNDNYIKLCPDEYVIKEYGLIKRGLASYYNLRTPLTALLDNNYLSNKMDDNDERKYLMGIPQNNFEAFLILKLALFLKYKKLLTTDEIKSYLIDLIYLWFGNGFKKNSNDEKIFIDSVSHIVNKIITNNKKIENYDFCIDRYELIIFQSRNKKRTDIALWQLFENLDVIMIKYKYTYDILLLEYILSENIKPARRKEIILNHFPEIKFSTYINYQKKARSNKIFDPYVDSKIIASFFPELIGNY